MWPLEPCRFLRIDSLGASVGAPHASGRVRPMQSFESPARQMPAQSHIIKYSHIIIHAKRTIAVPNTGTAAASNNRNKKIFKNCVPFTNHKSEKK